MEGGVRDMSVLQGLVSVEVAFTMVDLLQRVAGVVESWKFDNGDFPSSEQSFAGLGWPQELINGVDALQLIGEHDLHLLLSCPDASVGIHGGSGTLAC
jgi:hypothetical protein